MYSLPECKLFIFFVTLSVIHAVGQFEKFLLKIMKKNYHEKIIIITVRGSNLIRQRTMQSSLF